jgi:hypothetical protein
MLHKLGTIISKSQSTFINEHYSPLVISRNDKNKQLTLLSLRKLALTAITAIYLGNFFQGRGEGSIS